MTENYDNIHQLNEKLEILLKKQALFSEEINELRLAINKFTTTSPIENLQEKQEIKTDSENETTSANLRMETAVLESTVIPPKHSDFESPKSSAIKSDLEKFIGENLINKIGIIITVIGVAIGAKYSIEHQLISPLMRIILGYLMGLGLLGVGIRLKKNYENYSAVLVSGAMAILFFMTYAAYSFYALFPQGVAFLLMLAFTASTVVTAIQYNKQVIAHIGLVGAYAVPFLLSDGSGKVAILFSYMAIINIGILIIAIKKYWKPLYYSSFLLTWIIFISWQQSDYQMNLHFELALSFLAVFFLTFYAIFMVYKLLQKEKFEKGDIVLLLSNSFIFYGTTYAVLYAHPTGKNLLGLFTLGNAMIHMMVSIFIYKQKLADRNLFLLVAGLVLIFITIAIPVQLDGNWVTLLWAGEAALLFWIGRSKSLSFYEKLSYPLMLLAFVSIIQDWIFFDHHYYTKAFYVETTPLFNINFLTSFLFILAFACINYVNQRLKRSTSIYSKKQLNAFISFSIPAIFIIALYISFRIEIANYWDQLYHNSVINIQNAKSNTSEQIWNEDILGFKSLWIINYSLLFFTILSFVNLKKIKNSNLGYVSLIISSFVLFVFLTNGLYELGELRASLLSLNLRQHYQHNYFHIGIRYVSFAYVALLITSIYKSIQQDFIKNAGFKLTIAFDALLYISLLWIASSELINWMDIMHSTQSYKLGLSILWGIYALLMIVLGIWKKKKHLRVGAIIVFALTLIKLFTYDIKDLDTISKTIVFVLLGVLLLIISFLYNKYKQLIKDEEG